MPQIVNTKKILFIVGIVISMFCSWLFARRIEWSSLGVAFSEAEYIYIFPTVLLIFTGYYFRAVRWSVLISPVKNVSVLTLFSATMIGTMANNVLPARLGEVIRPVMIARKEKINVPTSFATVVMERVFDVLSIIVFASLLFFFLPSELSKDNRTSMANHVEASVEDLTAGNNGAISKDQQITTLNTIAQLKKWSYIMALFGVFAIMSLFLLSLYPGKAGTVFEKLLLFFPRHLRDRLVNLLHSFISGLQVFDNKKQLLWIACLSLIVWFFTAASVYVLCFSFDIGLSFAGACFVIVCLALAVALPQAPGFIGVFHIAIQRSLEVFGVGLSSSQSFAILLWAVSVIPVTITGILFLWREGMSFREISHYDEKLPVSPHSGSS